jgi:hypothetical protein
MTSSWQGASEFRRFTAENVKFRILNLEGPGGHDALFEILPGGVPLGDAPSKKKQDGRSRPAPNGISTLFLSETPTQN